ncbi:hypothetical protein [Cytobacillus sp. FSL K6-0265]|uniref:hypothetical protein n=1 Tax=Cytobacillus sp. FSL K6-0265 TaxID=2921448 RepID=UPI0030F9317E
MRFQLINWVIQIILMLGSAVWGYYLGKGTLFLIVVTGVYLCLIIAISFLINTILKIKDDLQTEKDRFSQELFSLKTSGQNNLDITLFPEQGYTFSSSTASEITVIVNTPSQTGAEFEFQITSDKEIELFINQGAPIAPMYHFSKYNYYISNSSAEKCVGKYYRLKLLLKPLVPNEHYTLEFTAQDSEIKGTKSLTFVAS